MGQTKKPRNKKYNPNDPKHIAPGIKKSQVYELKAQDMTQLVLLENIRRQASEAQTNYMLKLATQFGYPDGIKCTFEMDWNEAKLRVTMVEKAQPAAPLKGLNNKKG